MLVSMIAHDSDLEYVLMPVPSKSEMDCLPFDSMPERLTNDRQRIARDGRPYTYLEFISWYGFQLGHWRWHNADVPWYQRSHALEALLTRTGGSFALAKESRELMFRIGIAPEGWVQQDQSIGLSKGNRGCPLDGTISFISHRVAEEWHHRSDRRRNDFGRGFLPWPAGIGTPTTAQPSTGSWHQNSWCGTVGRRTSWRIFAQLWLASAAKIQQVIFQSSYGK